MTYLAGSSSAHALTADTPPSIWRAPLVPVALTTTAGIMVDRSFSPSLTTIFWIGVGLVAAWFLAAARGKPLLALAFLWATIGTLAAVYHHVRRDVHAPDDIGYLATEE